MAPGGGEGLERYRRKRDFERTPEPPPSERAPAGGARFMIQQLFDLLHLDGRTLLDLPYEQRTGLSACRTAG